MDLNHSGFDQFPFCLTYYGRACERGADRGNVGDALRRLRDSAHGLAARARPRPSARCHDRRAQLMRVHRAADGPMLSIAVAAALALAGCAAPKTKDLAADEAASAGERVASGQRRHITGDGEATTGEQATDGGKEGADIPAPVEGAPPLPEPSQAPAQQRYTVVVNEVPAQELLFSIARDADLEIDIIGSFDRKVTLNAVDETLPRLLERIAQQVPIRYELDEKAGYLKIAEDTPYLETYAVAYVDMQRSAQSRVTTATQVGTAGAGGSGPGKGSAGDSGNNSQTRVTNTTDNRFWQSLERNLERIAGGQPAGSSQDGGDGGVGRVTLNRETGHATVRATQTQHDRVQAYIDRVVTSARRQVLIEATVVEVRLNDRHQSGVDWSLIANQASGLDIVQNLTGSALGGALAAPDPDDPGQPAATIGYADPSTGQGSLRSTIKLLERFGEVSVVSSPKISALNNQLAILKVVDNRVYFRLEVEETEDKQTSETTTQVDSEPKTVPVGLVMSVTPYISSGQEVLLNVRPTVSRIVGFRNDPNPQLADAGVQNPVPEIQVREMESLLRVNSGQVAVIGGLMQDSIDNTDRSVPVLGDLPLIGGLFSYRDDRVEKTELIVFLRPKIVADASLNGDYRAYRSFLPEAGRGTENQPTPADRPADEVSP